MIINKLFEDYYDWAKWDNIFSVDNAKVVAALNAALKTDDGPLR